MGPSINYIRIYGWWGDQHKMHTHAHKGGGGGSEHNQKYATPSLCKLCFFLIFFEQGYLT